MSQFFEVHVLLQMPVLTSTWLPLFPLNWLLYQLFWYYPNFILQCLFDLPLEV